MKRIKFLEYYKEYMTSLFTSLASNTRLTSLNYLKEIIKTDDSDSLDLLYLSHSGIKYISPFLKILTLEDVASDVESRMNSISDAILIKYGESWDRIIRALISDYNPIDNYSMTEHEEYNSKIKNESNLNRFGFNTESTDGVSDTKTESTTSGTKDDNYKDLTRSGNIGVTTSQQMIESEIELRKNHILDIIFNDIDKLLCLKVY